MLSDISNIALDNKYTKWYYNIIDRAITRVDQTLSIAEQKKFITQQLGYVEGHHILPKAIGGSNSKKNIALLTPKEHFVCHWLLCYMFNDILSVRKMNHAMGMFRRASNKQHRQFSSAEYSIAKILHASATSSFFKELFSDPIRREQNKHTTDVYYSDPKNVEAAKKRNKASWTEERRLRQRQLMQQHIKKNNGFDRLSKAGKSSWDLSNYEKQLKIDKMAIGQLNKAIKNYPKLSTSQDLSNFKKFIVSLTITAENVQIKYGISQWTVLRWRKEARK